VICVCIMMGKKRSSVVLRTRVETRIVSRDAGLVV